MDPPNVNGRRAPHLSPLSHALSLTALPSAPPQQTPAPSAAAAPSPPPPTPPPPHLTPSLCERRRLPCRHPPPAPSPSPSSPSSLRPRPPITGQTPSSLSGTPPSTGLEQQPHGNDEVTRTPLTPETSVGARSSSPSTDSSRPNHKVSSNNGFLPMFFDFG